MVNKLRVFLLLIIIMGAKYTLAQEVNINRIELKKGGDVVIHYDLLDDDLDRRYSIHLYSSQDNYVQPLDKVEGDIGVDIEVGGNKKVIWHAREELGRDYSGNIGLELKGSIYTPFIILEGFEKYEELKRGKQYRINWSGGRGNNIIQFELYRGDKRVEIFEERPNVGKTNLIIPTRVKPGDNYYFKISDYRNRDEVVYSHKFEVKRKYPLLLQLGAGILVSTGAGILLFGNGNGTNPNDNEIPKPPRPE